MKTIIQHLAALCCCASAHAAQQLVVPGGLTNTEGNSFSGDLFVNGIAHLQQVYSASEFAFLGAPTGRVDAISFRLDGETGQSFAGVWPSVSVFVSTTTRSPDSLSAAFSDNIGADVIRVFGGGLVISAMDSSQPQPFAVRIPFQTPFLYDPARGNLVIDILALGTRNLSLDAQMTFGDGVGRVFANPDALSGTVDTLGLVTRFDITPIPEPSTVALLLVGGSVPFLFSSKLRGRSSRK
jgi:hypothetical protein